MDIQSNNPETWFSALLAIVLGWLGLTTRRQVSQYDETTKDHALRLRVLETTVATKGDVTALYERVIANGDRMNEQHATVLKILLGHRRNE